MIESCTVYLPTSQINFQAILPGGTFETVENGRPIRYDYESPQGPVKVAIHLADDDSDHLDHLDQYVAGLDDHQDQRGQAIELIDNVEMFLGVFFSQPVSFESEAFQALLFLVEQTRGFVFVSNSILLPSGYLVGPMANKIRIPDATTGRSGHVAPQQPGPEADFFVSLRKQNTTELSTLGFTTADWLPLSRAQEPTNVLRPADEIASRLFCGFALFMWVAAPEEKASTDGLRNFIATNRLEQYMTREELHILASRRDEAKAQFGESIRWHLENMWPLAWVFGFEPAPEVGGQMAGDLTGKILTYVPNLGGTVSQFVASKPQRSNADVVRMEDLFYCAHNAVRSAQVGEATVPEGFHPVSDGGAIHERRHALTWALSPGVHWDQTDLST